MKADGTTTFDATDTPCDPAKDGPKYEACLHGGELRAALVPNVASCTGITAEDSATAFDWTCVEKAGQAWVVSSGLNETKHLADLIDFPGTSFRKLTLTVSDEFGTIATSAPAIWWANPIIKVTTKTVDVAAPHDVLISSGATAVVGPVTDNLSFVSEPGTFHGAPVTIRGNFSWSEPRVDPGSFTVSNGAFVVLRGATIMNGGGFKAQVLRASRIEDVVSKPASNVAAAAFQVTGTRVSRVTTGPGATGAPVSGISTGPVSGVKTADSTFEDLSDTGSGRGIMVHGTQGSTLKRLSSYNGLVSGNYVGAIDIGPTAVGCTFEDVTVVDAALTGIEIDSINSTFRRVRVQGNKGELGIRINGGAGGGFGNRFEDVRIVQSAGVPGSGQRGIQVSSGWNVLQNVHVSGTAQPVLINGNNLRIANLFATAGDRLLEFSGGAVVQNATLAGAQWVSSSTNSRGNALGISSVNASRYVGNVLAINNERSLSVFSTFGTAARFRNSVFVGSSSEAVAIGPNQNVTFDGVLRMGRDGSGPMCVVDPSAVGLSNTCMTELPSTAAIQEGLLATDVIVGPVTQDAVNVSSAGGGEAPYDPGLDFLGFETLARAYGRTGALPWPSVDQRGACGVGDTCQIFDYSLLAGDTAARELATLPTGNDVVAVFDKLPSGPTTQADCDAGSSPGSKLVGTTTPYCESRFLRDAVEVMFDGIGDDDNLCESGEVCIFSPNAGAYQGHGNLVNAGTFVDGEIVGVTLMRYETNGR